ncbi:MAG TPA: nicotinate-nucleotide adenylyltransferase [Kiritimatiellia bacterium]|nr:nicotinate-nucleotide adenylyltransferase [Kiritimatiellia bacterium]
MKVAEDSTLGLGWISVFVMSNLRIGLFGGSFNPVHLGHLIMAQDALEAQGLDRVVFVPASSPPHKLTEPMAEAGHRLEMLRMAVGDHPQFEVDDVEIRRGGVSYTIDTVKGYRTRYPEAELFFIIGGDTLPELATWKNLPELDRLCTFVTVLRPGFDEAGLKRSRHGLAPAMAEKLFGHVVQGHSIGISSSEIRVHLARGRPVRYLVPPLVERYIEHHRLYSS